MDVSTTAPLSVTNSTVRDTRDAGIRVLSTKAITISGTTVTNTGHVGIEVTQQGTASNVAASTTTVTNNTVDGVYLGGNGADGIVIHATNPSGTPALDNLPAPTLTGNTVRGVIAVDALNDSGLTTGIALRVEATNLLPGQLAGNTATGNTLNVLELAGTLKANMTLPLTGPPLIVGYTDGNIGSGLAIAAGVTLTANPGTTLKFDTGYQPGLQVNGTLSAAGTAASPVVFTSLLDDSVGGDTNGDGTATTPHPGDWAGISGGGVVNLDRVDVRYASSGMDVSTTAPLSVTNSTVRDTRDAGIRVLSTKAITISGTTVTNTGHVGIEVTQQGTASNVAASTTTVTNNTVDGVYLGGNGADGIVIHATNPSGTPALDNLPAPTLTGNTVRGVIAVDALNDSGLTTGIALRVEATNLLPGQLAGNTATGNTLNVLELAGTLKANMTLPLTGPPLIVGYTDGNIGSGLAIAAGVTLTANPGTTLKFDTGYQPGLQVNGTLSAAGTAASPVVFTSLLDDSVGGDTNGDGTATTPHPGDWAGISGGGVVNLDRVDVRYASSGMDVSTTAPLSVTNSTVRDTRDAGIRVLSTKAITISGTTVTNTGHVGIEVTQQGTASNVAASTTTVTNNTVDGVYLGGNGADGIVIHATNPSGTPALDNLPAPTLTGNTVRGVIAVDALNDSGLTTGIALRVEATNLLPGQLAGNTATGNTLNVLELAGTLKANMTLPLTGPPLIVGYTDGNIGSGLAIAAGVTLTANPGTTLKFDTGYQPGLQVNGTLSAAGTAASPVVFTSLLDDSVGGDTNGDGTATTPHPGDWAGISGGGVVNLDRVDVRYASSGMDVSTTAPLSVTNSTVRDTRDAGIRVLSTKAITISGTTVTNTGHVGIEVTQQGTASNVAASTTTVTNNTVDGVYLGGNGADGIVIHATNPSGTPALDNLPAPTLTGNTVRGVIAVDALNDSGLTTGIALRVEATNLLPGQLAGNTATGNTLNVLELAGTLKANMTLPLTGPPLIVGYTDGNIGSGLAIAAGVTLTANPGTTLKFDTGYQPGLQVNGTLSAAGTAASPVVFTSLLDDSVAGTPTATAPPPPPTPATGPASSSTRGEWPISTAPRSVTRRLR